MRTWFQVAAWDMNTGQKLTDVQPTGLSFTTAKNQAGPFQFTLPIGSQAKARAAAPILAASATTPVIITISTGQLIVYAGIVWSVDRTKKDMSVPVAGKSLTSYFEHLRIASDYGATRYPSGVATTTLMDTVITEAQAQPGAWSGLTPQVIMSAAGVTPLTFIPSYAAAQRTMVSQTLSDVTSMVTPGLGGVDYHEYYQWVGGQPQFTLRILCPRSGRQKDASGLCIDLSKATDWSWPTDLSQMGTTIDAVGEGSGGVQPVGTATTAIPVGGLGQPPLMHLVEQYSRIADVSQLTAVAQGLATLYGQPVSAPTVTIPWDYKPMPLGSFVTGDDVHVTSPVCQQWPAGLDVWMQIVSCQVAVPDDGLPTMILTLNPVVDY